MQNLPLRNMFYHLHLDESEGISSHIIIIWISTLERFFTFLTQSLFQDHHRRFMKRCLMEIVLWNFFSVRAKYFRIACTLTFSHLVLQQATEKWTFTKVFSRILELYLLHISVGNNLRLETDYHNKLPFSRHKGLKFKWLSIIRGIARSLRFLFFIRKAKMPD